MRRRAPIVSEREREVRCRASHRGGPRRDQVNGLLPLALARDPRANQPSLSSGHQPNDLQLKTNFETNDSRNLQKTEQFLLKNKI